MKKFFGYLFLAFGMAFALSYFQNSSVNALDGSYDDAIMGQSSHIDQDENKIEDAKEENSYSLRTMIQNGWFYQGNKKCFCDNDGRVIGENVKKVIDVSQYNGHIDWSKVSKTDVDGVIIRIVSHKGGYYHIDEQFENNLNGCRKYNIPFGIYIYDYSNNVTDADNEATMILNYLSKYKISPSELSYPVYLDMERPELSTTTNELVVDAFVNKLANSNYNTKVYSYRSLLQTKLNSPTIYQHVDWVAAYTSSLGFSNNWYRGPKGWQYSNGAFVDGISGYVDMSVWYDQGVPKYDYVGWKYYYDHWYYGSSKNILQIGWEKINGKWYYFNTNGIMATGWISLNGEWYYLTSNGDMVTGAQTINNKEYYFTSEGVMVRGWHKENDKWKYYSPKKMSVYGRTFVEGEKVTGWLPINDKWYYIAEDGYMVTGIYKVGNRKYLFMEDGSMKTGWFKVDGTWYYISPDGELRAQWVKSLSNWYYVNDEGLILTGDQVINGRQYYFNEDGIMHTGWMQVGNQWKYYSQGTLKIYGKTFVDGEKVTGWLPLGNRWYYIANDDYMVTGYYKVGNSTYYFDESGLMKTGWFKINGEDYYAASSGAIQAQWVKSLSNWYYVDVDGKMVTGYQTINGAKYYFASSGLMQKDWFKINGEDYYAASSGTIQAQWVKSGRNWYYVDTDGKMVTGDYIIDGKVNYLITKVFG